VIPVGADPVSLPRAVGGDAFEAVHRPGYGDLCWVFDLEMGVVVFPMALGELRAEVGTHRGEHLPEKVVILAGEHSRPVLRHEDRVLGHTVPRCPVVLFAGHRSRY
jgi:hypothetical protein